MRNTLVYILGVLALGCCILAAVYYGFSRVPKPRETAPAETPGSAGPSPAPTASEHAGEHSFPANALAKETSPYLLMHAHNPVQWHPWNEAALEKARRENKMIFLSIGYSSCHWCHVMERESFMDEEIAEVLNQHFVCIKVDREERPDIDTIYMKALSVYQRLAQSSQGGGWPLSMFLTPDAQPFFGGTYFPPRDGDRGVTTGFLTVLEQIQKVWNEAPERVTSDAELIAKYTQQELAAEYGTNDSTPGTETLDLVQAFLADNYDARFGGFGYDPNDPQRPKFPEPSNLYFLLHVHRTREDKKALEMATSTLDWMAAGGIRDHIGGGFHRYSVDRSWKIPHFEKMLYDNGQLASIYAEAYAQTGRDEYRRVVIQLNDFVLREMTDAGGAFYSAIDADSEAEEGKFYRWTKEELTTVLTKPVLESVAELYSLGQEPNYEETSYVPQYPVPIGELTERLERREEEIEQLLQPVRKTLLGRREQRVRPLTDTKILTSWNGLMIRGLADSGRILKDKSYVDAAAKAADFILANLQSADGRLQRTFSGGSARLNAYLPDYAFLVDGLIALHAATDEPRWLAAARSLTDTQIDLFWDDQAGGFFFTSDDHESLLARAKNPTDGARPAGNSVAAENLIRLAILTGDPQYLNYAEKTVRSVGKLLARAPGAVPRMAVAVDLLHRELETTSPTNN